MQSEIDELKQRPSAAVSPHTNSVNSLIQEMGQLKLRVDHQGVAIDTIKRNITDLRLNIAFEEDLLDDLEDFDRKVSCRCRCSSWINVPDLNGQQKSGAEQESQHKSQQELNSFWSNLSLSCVSSDDEIRVGLVYALFRCCCWFGAVINGLKIVSWRPTSDDGWADILHTISNLLLFAKCFESFVCAVVCFSSAAEKKWEDDDMMICFSLRHMHGSWVRSSWITHPNINV